MRRAGTCWLLAGVVGLASWPAAAPSQPSLWETQLKAAAKAAQEGRNAEAEQLLQSALNQAERFGPQDPR